MSTDHLTFDKPKRTQMDCHQCHKNFVAILDYTLNGNHIIECAWCGHEHCRVIENGRVTEERWSTRYGDDRSKAHRPRRIWKSNSLPAKTSAVHEFIRDRWLEKYYDQ